MESWKSRLLFHCGLSSVNNKRGGPGRGQGRKPLKQGEDSVTISLRVTVTQRDKLLKLGGAKWIRDKIDKEDENELHQNTN